MTVDEIKNKYGMDAASNADAIRKADAFATKIVPLAKRINEAEYKYNSVVEKAVAELNKIIAPLDKDVKAEAKNIFKRWCRPVIKGL